MLARLIVIGIIIPMLLLVGPDISARNLTDQQRYSDGYSNGGQAASTDTNYNPTCDPTNAYTSGGGHTPTYCKGWFDGYTATWNTNHPSTVTNIQTQPPSQPQNNVGPNSVTSGSTPWQEFGVFFGPIQVHSGVYHNENGVFIPWNTLCSHSQSYLNESCASLVNSDGSLTSDGDRAVGCVTNGAILTIAAAKFNIPLDTIKSILGGLAGPTGCGNIVNLNQIQTSPDLQRLTQYMGTIVH
jgi:hypothetical protein